MQASCLPLACTCLKSPASWAPRSATGELQEKGLSIKKGTSTQPLVQFLLEINTAGASTYLLGPHE